MGAYNPPLKNTALVFDVSLEDANSTGRAKLNPTLAAGDVKIEKDDGAAADLATLPVAVGAASPWVKVSVSSTEMNADRVKIVFRDATTPREWNDLSVCLLTV